MKDELVASRIRDELRGFDRIVEIGGGRGALTEKLVELGAELTVVELDNKLALWLKEHFAPLGVKIIEGDAARIDLPDDCAVVGNLPYNVAKMIIRNVINQKHKIKKAVFMVQKEVADSIVAAPSEHSYSRFTVLVQLFFKPRRLFNVPPGAFLPPPKVQSSVVSLIPRETNLLKREIDERFFGFLNALFAHPRKTVKNNIKAIERDIKMNESVKGLLEKRPGDLKIEEMYKLFLECTDE